MASMDQIFQATLSPDAGIRESAVAQLQQFEQANYPQYISALSTELANEQGDANIRNAVGLALKNSLSAREHARREEYATRWKNVDGDTRQKIKEDAMRTLGSAASQARTAAGQVIAAIANIELPFGLWSNLITDLLKLLSPEAPTILRQATLQTIGFVCETVKPEILASQSNQILTAVVQGARKEEPSPEVQHAAIRALFNSLEFVHENFQSEGERNYIMQVVCEATQSQSQVVQIGAFECLVRIMQLYYDKMRFYMERALFGLTVLGMKSANEGISLQAIEFWSTVCEEEIDLEYEAIAALDLGEQTTRQSQHFAKIALPEVLPVLLALLPKKDEDADEDEWNPSMAAATCLSLMAQCVTDAIVTPIIPYVESHIKSPDWRLKEAAVMAFGSILEGPSEKLTEPLASQALPMLIAMMEDPSDLVKDTTAWTLGRISDFLINTIKPDEVLRPLITSLMRGLHQSPRIVSNCCWSIMNITEQLGSGEEETTVVSPYYPAIVSALLEFTANAHTNENNGRTSAYAALATLATHAPSDVIASVQDLALKMIERSEVLLSKQDQILSIDDRNNYDELQVNLISVLTAIIRRIGKDIKPLGDRIMTLLLQLVSTAGKKSPILEDAFLCIGALTSALETDFANYMGAFSPYLQTALESHEEYQLCSVAVGLIGDICRALGEQSIPYCDGFMKSLVDDLQSAALHRSVKPLILSAFGDVALSIGAAFEPYLTTTMNVLSQAGGMRADPSNIDLVEYINQLREGILEAYVGIIGGLKAGNRKDLIQKYLSHVFTFLHLALTDQDRTPTNVKLAIGLIGDLAEAFPSGEIKAPLRENWIQDTLKSGKTYLGGPEAKKLAKWAKEMVRIATQ